MKKEKIKNVLSWLCIVMVIVNLALVGLLHNIGYFTNDCINLNNVKNWYIDDTDNLQIIVKSPKTTHNATYFEIEQYTLEK